MFYQFFYKGRVKNGYLQVLSLIFLRITWLVQKYLVHLQYIFNCNILNIMKKVLSILFALVCCTSLASAVTYVYNGRSTYSGDILLTWDGKYLYQDKSTYSGDILLTFDGRYVYKGKSEYSGDILLTWDGKYLYSGKSTYSGDILLTWDGSYIYSGKSTYSGDILYTYNRQYVYKGRSTYSGDVLLTIDGSLPIAVLMMVLL